MTRHVSILGVSLRRLLLPVLFLTAAPNAWAETCVLDTVPAATVLVPYFEVDLTTEAGVTTYVNLHNASPEATLAKITFWTDWSIPTLYFDVFLTGYDVVRLDLRDIFTGNIPITADEQSDPDDMTSPHGVNPEWDSSFTDCENIFPFLENPVIVDGNLARLVDGHTGQPVVVDQEELCLGEDHSDLVARGYLTIDDAQRCALLDPSEPGYFGGANPVASNDNQLWAEVWLDEPGKLRRTAVPAVHLEADLALGQAGFTNTFYSRYSDGADRRERLPTRWGAPARSNAALEDEWIVWRDGGSDETTGYGCPINRQAGPRRGGGFPPAPGDGFWQPLLMNAASCYDLQEGLTETCDGQDCLDLETQRVGASTVAAADGWCDLDLSSVGDAALDPSQAWVGILRRSPVPAGDAGVFTATVLGGDCVVPEPVFKDGFESGDTSAWSGTVGGAS